MKKKILVVIESLVCAGAEKSLATLLNLLDYEKYEVDLQLFSYGGEFEAMLPAEVNLLSPLPYFAFCALPLRCALKQGGTVKGRRFIRSRLNYSIKIRTGYYNNPQKAVLFWRAVGRCFEMQQKKYDVAVAYAQGTPTFYVADCVRARRKLAWVNVSYRPSGEYRCYIEQKYALFDQIVCVSDSAYQIFTETFPEVKQKGTIVYDINDGAMMEKMSQMESAAEEEMKGGKWKILTVGRFAAQKGYDIALEACRILKSHGIDFRWYVLGRGSMEKEIREQAERLGVADVFILLGTRANPYPYYRCADIYVQTSRFEGFGLAIAEARMLNIPVVTTRFDAVYAQMIEGENGLVVDMNGQAVADGIQRLMGNPDLFQHIIDFQKSEKKDNYEELEKIYQLLG